MLREHLTQNVIPMKFKELLAWKRGQGSIVGTATNYMGLTVHGSTPSGARSLCQNLSTGPGAHAASRSTGTGTVPRCNVAGPYHLSSSPI
jgi:hypothetical protein